MLQKFYSFYHVVFFYQFWIFENKNTRKMFKYGLILYSGLYTVTIILWSLFSIK